MLPLAVLAQSQDKDSRKLLNYTEAFGSGWAPKQTALQWVSADVDGTYVDAAADNSLIFVNIVTGANETFVDAGKLGIDYYDYWIQPSRENVLFASNRTKQYRHSYFADYYVFNRASGTVKPIVADQAGDIQYAGWNSVGDLLAFVRNNDLYIWKNGVVTRITKDGGPDVFNGVPDWVYEEGSYLGGIHWPTLTLDIEIFGDRSTLWFSPDGEYLAFLSFNETGVPTYTIPYYMASKTIAPPYPFELELRYPKVSETNPTVTLNLLNVKSGELKGISLDTPTSFKPDNLIIGEVRESQYLSNLFANIRNRWHGLRGDTQTSSAALSTACRTRKRYLE